ncbi:MAG: hypothetical protein ACKOCK_10660, partial [Chloroflexota bacterium]
MRHATLTLAVVTAGILAVGTLPALAAEDGQARETAIGTDAGTIVYDDSAPAPDGPTVIYVGTDANMLVDQPDLGAVPSMGDGVFIDVLPELNVPTSGDGVFAVDAGLIGSGCGNYGYWYDAQIAMESSTDPLLIAALDP